MSKPLLKVIKPGLLTTVQDLGRLGYQQYGIVAAGVMDAFSMQIGNLLVGNPRNEAVLEISIIGPTLQALDDMLLAICGGNLFPTVDGKKIDMWKSFILKKGQILSFGAPVEGARAYLSIAGGFDIPIVMGSKSTYIKAGIGGYKGRALQKDDILFGKGILEKRYVGRLLHYDEIPTYKSEIHARVILGPHLHYFTEEGIQTFLTQTFEISSQSDRMGYRLNGPQITHLSTADIISDAIPFGGIQVPSNGHPIVLMADRQTTGGYTRIATVISVDLPLLAQALPGHTIRFSSISVEEAQVLYKKRENLFYTLSLLA
ncbi:MAG: biotin-dependent carboxyltransferase family protein [Tepidibacillus sp.]|uniref:5-oxoprolinase subunit C family protein n=1 Tax=Tepidibacillus sp. HK-1 TaxID=1883407 RepID=UPI000853EE5F|nr:biotin-dependent carboxyltransferase family protein [Tepidibacillus sp. HK-1]GBF10904.1 kipI antagonist [Tepidibacillus sp. HK-1]